MKILRFLPLAALLAASASPAAANEIANPGFEENADEPVSWETPIMAGTQGGEPLSEVRVVSEGAAAGNEAHLAAMERLLGTSHPDPICVYKYADNERKEEITGDPGNAHVENGNEIHSVFWGDRHEIVPPL